MSKQVILITGAFGQIGTDLIPQLQNKYGYQNIIALGHHNIPKDFNGIIQKGDVMDQKFIRSLVQKYKLTQIYHLAALLSSTGQKNPQLCWDLNLIGVKMIMDICVQHKIRLFWPSSIACFGPTTPRQNTPQHTINQPITMYGVTKFSGQLLCQYYHHKFGLDVRSLRYPGLISWKAPPGGGTTDYSVAIFYEGLQNNSYTCFVNQKTSLPMMYMDDAVRGTIQLMQQPSQNIKIRTSYNFAAVSFTAQQLAQQVKKHIPGFTIKYQPDQRQKNADSWPSSIDDSQARKDWNWNHKFGLKQIAQDMIQNLKKHKGLGLNKK